MTKLEHGKLVEQFLAEVPEMTWLYEHQLRAYGVMNTLFFGIPMVKAVQSLLRRSIRRPPINRAAEILFRILDFVERAAASDDEDIITVMATGFLESLYVAGDDYEIIASLLGPKSREILKAIEEDPRLGIPSIKNNAEFKETYAYVDENIKRVLASK